jgi:hypothetical protein
MMVPIYIAISPLRFSPDVVVSNTIEPAATASAKLLLAYVEKKCIFASYSGIL